MIELRPIYQDQAFAFVREHHRHHNVPVGSLWQHAVHDGEGVLIGVAVVGRPVARKLDDGLTVEVTRLCTLDSPTAFNACSMLYGAARRVAGDKGFRRGLSYILESENGTSLRAAGWEFLWKTEGGSWARPSRFRQDNHPLEPKDAYGFGAWPQLVKAQAA